jgi:hypothetical protein
MLCKLPPFCDRALSSSCPGCGAARAFAPGSALRAARGQAPRCTADPGPFHTGARNDPGSAAHHSATQSSLRRLRKLVCAASCCAAPGKPAQVILHAKSQWMQHRRPSEACRIIAAVSAQSGIRRNSAGRCFHLCLTGCGDSKGGPSLVSGLVKSAATHDHNCLSLGLLWKDRALESFCVLNDVVLARKGRRSQSDDDETGEEEFCLHVRFYNLRQPTTVARICSPDRMLRHAPSTQ